jgi:predicted metal-dependent HD superfamily phosphohydrolase
VARTLSAKRTTNLTRNDALISRYTEPNAITTPSSTYTACYNAMAVMQPLSEEKIEMKLAIYFHNWVYDPQDTDNESLGIECFKAFTIEAELPEVGIIRLVLGESRS